MTEKNPFSARLREAIGAFQLANCHLLLAISGGADSVALLCGLVALGDEWRLRLSAAHLNHRLRGAASDEDARWVEELCSRLGVPVVLHGEDIREIAGRRGRGVEETAREVRYAFLQRTARRLGCSHVVTAHTADDQAETILHNIIRGTGVAGLAGMSSLRPLDHDLYLVRPLLEVGRADVETYLREIGQPHREDETNLDESFTRNRIRRLLLPLLRSEFNPQVADALRRLGRQAADVRDAMDRLCAKLLDDALLERSREVCRLRLQVLQNQPRHLVRECFARLWKQQAWPRQRMGFDDWDRLALLALGEEDGPLSLPGAVQAARRGNLLMLRRP